MDIQNLSLNRISRIAWDSMQNSSVQSTPFSSYRWLSILADSFPDYNPGALVALDDEKYLAAIPYVYFNRAGFRQILALPWGTPVGGAFDDNDSAEIELLRLWETLWPGALGRQAIVFSLELPSAGEARRILRACRLRRQRYLQVPLAGRSFDGWESELSQSTRNQNRQSRKRGVEFHEIEVADQATINGIQRLRKKTAGRHGAVAARFNDDFIVSLVERSNGLVRVFAIRLENELVAYSVCLFSRDGIWLWDYATDEQYNDYRPNNLMYSELIRLAIRERKEWLDLGAVPEGADGLLRFKKSMGGVEHFRTEAVRTSAMFAGVDSIRKFFRGSL